MARVLVLGGAGYIGSHALVELRAAGHDVVVLDSFANSKQIALQQVEAITSEPVPTVRGDVRDTALVKDTLERHGIDAVMHFAGLKAVGESQERPLAYYSANVEGAISLLRAMQNANVRKLIFSSSATVYGEPQMLPIPEDHRLYPVNPYGRTKLMVEDILRDVSASDADWRICLLRYFNPCGAHESGLIGEDPSGVPNNLVPYISQVAAGRRKKLHIWGADYGTPDGTGVRDYIHVVDLCRGHVRALEFLGNGRGCRAINLGTGRGFSVLEMLQAFSKACGRDIPYSIEARRPGDIAVCYADCSLARELLGWEADLTLEDMCQDHWRWQVQNPDGFGS